MRGFQVFLLLMKLFILFAVFVESSTTHNSLLADETFGGSGKCNIGDLIPGLDKMQTGIEISELELHPANTNSNYGFRKQLFMFTCNGDQTWTNPHTNVRYRVPDQLEDPVKFPVRAKDANTSFTRDSTEYRLSLEAQFGGSAKLSEEISFGSSTSIKYFEQKTTQKLKYSHQISASVTAMHFTLQRTSPLSLAPDFVYAIDNLPSGNILLNPTKDELMEYIQIFLDFGTHYFEEIMTGGRCYQEYNIDSSYVAKTTDLEIERNVEASFVGLFNISRGLNFAYGTVDENFKESSILYSIVAGGSGSPLLGSSSNATAGLAAPTRLKTHFDDWANSLYDFPFIIGGKLKPIQNLIQDSAKKVQLNYAFIQYKDYIKNVIARRRYQNIKDSKFAFFCPFGDYSSGGEYGRNLATEYSLEEHLSNYAEGGPLDGDKLLELADFAVDETYIREQYLKIEKFYKELTKSCITSCKKELKEFEMQKKKIQCKSKSSLRSFVPMNRKERIEVLNEWRELELKYIEPLR